MSLLDFIMKVPLKIELEYQTGVQVCTFLETFFLIFKVISESMMLYPLGNLNTTSLDIVHQPSAALL